MTNRYLRQKDLVPIKILTNTNIIIVGIGAIGRQVAIQLASMGAMKLTLIDFDIVEETNISSQGYLESQLGMTKIDALTNSLLLINKDIKISGLNEKFKTEHIKLFEENEDVIVFACVDSLDIRSFIFNSFSMLKDASQTEFLFLDGRMAGEIIRHISYNSKINNPKDYEETIINDSQALQETCTAKTTIYTASIVAGLMISSFIKFIRTNHVEFDMMLNLFTSEYVSLKER